VRKRHVVLILLALLSIITFVDRLAIAVAGPRIQEELRIPPHLWGWVLGAFVLAYGIFEIPTGAMGDRIGQRKVLARIVLWWSAFTALTGVAYSFAALVIIRFLFGAGEAGAFPNASGVVARWFPVHERARAQGVVFAASRLGGALTPLIVVPLQALLGWRVTCGSDGTTTIAGGSRASALRKSKRSALRPEALTIMACRGERSSARASCGSLQPCISFMPRGHGFTFPGSPPTW